MPAIDTLPGTQISATSPPVGAEEITPSDTGTLIHVTRAIYVGGPGDLRVTMKDGQTVTLTAVQPGVVYPLRCIRVRATGTTATGLVGLF